MIYYINFVHKIIHRSLDIIDLVNQAGGDELRNRGILIGSLAIIYNLADCTIKLR